VLLSWTLKTRNKESPISEGPSSSKTSNLDNQHLTQIHNDDTFNGRLGRVNSEIDGREK
jgi:hypothetical protein